MSGLLGRLAHRAVSAPATPDIRPVLAPRFGFSAPSDIGELETHRVESAARVPRMPSKHAIEPTQSPSIARLAAVPIATVHATAIMAEPASDDAGHLQPASVIRPKRARELDAETSRIASNEADDAAQSTHSWSRTAGEADKVENTSSNDQAPRRLGWPKLDRVAETQIDTEVNFDSARGDGEHVDQLHGPTDAADASTRVPKPSSMTRPMNAATAVARAERSDRSSVAAPPTINVTIGRIEIRATTPAPMPQPGAPRTPCLTLDDFLAKRSGRT